MQTEDFTMTEPRGASGNEGSRTIVVDAMSQVAGGGLVYLQNFLKKLVELDEHNDYHVVLRSSVRVPDIDYPDNVHFVRVGFFGCNLFLRFFYEQVVLPVYLLAWKADLLFVSGGVPPLLTHCRKVLMVHNPNPYSDTNLSEFPLLKLKFWLHRWLTWLSVGSLEKVIAVSEWARDRLREELDLPDDKCEVVHHGIDHSLFASNGQEPSGKELPAPFASERPLVLAVSTLNPHKNFEVLLKAVDRLRSRDYPLELVIVGRTAVSSYRNKLNRMVKELDLESCVTFHGRVEHERLPEYYHRADAFVLPSEVESFGLTLLEAMAASTPVIASERSSIPEVTDGAASLFDPKSPDDLAHHLRNVTDNESLNTDMVDRGHERARRFDWTRSIDETLSILRDTANND